MTDLARQISKAHCLVDTIEGHTSNMSVHGVDQETYAQLMDVLNMKEYTSDCGGHNWASTPNHSLTLFKAPEEI